MSYFIPFTGAQLHRLCSYSQRPSFPCELMHKYTVSHCSRGRVGRKQYRPIYYPVHLPLPTPRLFFSPLSTPFFPLIYPSFTSCLGINEKAHSSVTIFFSFAGRVNKFVCLIFPGRHREPCNECVWSAFSPRLVECLERGGEEGGEKGRVR